MHTVHMWAKSGIMASGAWICYRNLNGWYNNTAGKNSTVVKTTILYKRIVLKLVQFQDNVNSAIKCVIALVYANVSNDELLSSFQRSFLPPPSWYKQSQESDCENFISSRADNYVYIIFFHILKSEQIIFTINIGATCIRGFVTTDNIN